MATFQTLQTGIGHNATRYHNFNTLPQALLYIFFEICLVLSYFQRVTTGYRHFLFNQYIFFINLMVTRGNALQIAPNRAKLREKVW